MLDPDMPAQTMRLHMGEITAQEMRTARAAIRWANSKATTEIERLRMVLFLIEDKDASYTIDDLRSIARAAL